jgi:hypothetical protein
MVLEEVEREALAVLDRLVRADPAREAWSAERALELAAEVVVCTPPLTPARAWRLVREQPEWLLRSCELPASAPISALDVLQALVAEHIVLVVCTSAGCDRLEQRLLEWPGCHREPVAASRS